MDARQPPLSNSEGPGARSRGLHPAGRPSCNPSETVRIDLVTGVAETRDAVTAHDGKILTIPAWRTASSSWPGRTAKSCCGNSTPREADAQVYGRLAGSMIYASALRRAKASVLIRNRRGQSGLWGYGISGDLPIVLVRIRDRARIELVRQAVQAHAYWRMKGLAVDLVIWNEDDSVYRQTLAGRDHGPRRRQPGSGAGGQARRHLRAPRRADVGRRSSAVANRGARRARSTMPARCIEQVERRGRARSGHSRFSKPVRADREPHRPPPSRPSAIWRFSTAWAASAATAANTSSSSVPARPRPRRGST